MLLIHTPCPSKGQRPADVLASALDQPRLPSLGFWQLLLAAFYFVARCAAGNGLLGCLSAALCHTATLLAAHELVALLSEPAPAPGLAGMTASGAHSPIGAADGAGTPQLSLRRSASSTSALQSPRRPSTSGQMLPPSARRSHAGPGELVVGGMALEHSDTSPIVTPAGGRARAGTVGAQLHANGGGYTDLRRSLPAGLSPGPSLPRSSSATASMHTKLMTTGSGPGGVPHSPVVPLRSYGSAGREALVGAAGMVTSALPTLDVGGLGDLAPPTGSRQHSSVHASPGAANRQSKTRSLAGGSPEGASPATKRGVSESGGGAVGLGLGEGTLLPQAGSIQGRRSSGGGPEASGSAGEARTEPGAVVASAGHSSNGGASLPLGDRAAGEGGTEEGADRPLGQEQSSAESSHCRVCSEELHAFRSHLPATRPLSPVEEGHSGPLAQPRPSTSGRAGGPRHHRRASSHRVSGSTHDYIMLASTVPGGDCCPPYRPPNGAFAPRGLDVEEEEEEEYDSEAYNDDDSDGCFSLVLDANGNPNPNGAAHAPGAQVLVSATANGPSGGAGINPRASTGGLWPGQVGPDAAAWAAAHGGTAGAASPGAGGLVRKHSHALHGVVPHPPDVYGCDVADLADLEDLMSLEEVEAVAAAEDCDLVAGASGGSRPPTRGGAAAATHSLGAVGRPGGPFAGLELCTGLGAGADSSMVAEDSYCGITTGPATPAHPAGPLGGALLPGPLRSRLGATGEGAAPGGADGAGAEGGLQAQGSVPLQEDTLARHTAASLAATAATAAAAAQAAARRSTGGAVDPALLPLLAPAGTSGELMDCFLRDAAMLVNGGYDTYDETESDVELLTTTTNTAATSSRHASRQPASGRGPAQALGAKAQAGWAEDEGDQEGDSSEGDRAGGSGGGSAQREQLQAMSRGQLLARQIYGAPPPEFLPFPLRDASAHPAAVFLPAPAVAPHHRSGAAIIPPPLPPPQQQQQQLRHSVGHVAHHGPSGHAEVVLVPSPHAPHAPQLQLQPQHAQQLALARSSRRSAATASASPNTTGAAGFVDGDLQPPQPSQGRSSGVVARLPGSAGHISPARAAVPPPLVALPHSQRHSMDSARHSHPSLAAAPDVHVPLVSPRGVGGGGYALPGLPPPVAAPAATAFLLQADQLRWEEMETFGLDEGSSGGVGGHGVQGNGSGGDGQGRPNLLRGSSSEPQWPSPGPVGPGQAQSHHGQVHVPSQVGPKPGPVQRQRSHSHCQALHAQHVAQHAAQHAPHAQHGLLKTHAHGHSLSHSHLPPYLGHQPLHRGGHHGRLMSPQEGDEEGSGEADGNDVTPTQHMSNRPSNFLSHPFDEPGAHLLKAVTVCGAVRGSPGDPRGFVGSAGGAVPARPTLVNPFECAGQMQYRSLSFQHLNQPPHYDLHHRTASSRVSAFSPPGAAAPLSGAATPATGAAAATAADAAAAPPAGALTTQTSDGGASTAVSGAATAPAVTAAGAGGDSMYSVAAAASSLSGHDTRPTPPPTAMAGSALGPAAASAAPGPADGSLAAADPAPATDTDTGDSARAKDGLASTQEPQQGAPASPSPSLPLPPLGFGAIGAHLAAVKTMGGGGMMGSSGGGAVLAAFAAVGSDVASPLAPSEAAAAAAAAAADLPPELPPAPSASSMVTRLTLPSVDGWPAHCPGGGGGVFSPPLHGSWGAAFFQGEGEGESDEEGDTPADAERRRSRAAGGASATATAGVAADGAAAAAGTAVGPEA
ncbi:hypothetical protein HYH03_016106 [Edaphochlamys debaryana]|uniref:Uncharacterized protein n=1 Tax=Edaphochlamys debaryana TaxID=47281 RepID=A0A835XSB0_9CHLO|nr:hypothetical protein HYH03_016106 [Edaphochlamys debaryana]|eukprot:KAG2485119.1 hypothetical protein HYH03_016106 [Edaphochlamys debaryana]